MGDEGDDPDDDEYEKRDEIAESQPPAEPGCDDTRDHRENGVSDVSCRLGKADRGRFVIREHVGNDCHPARSVQTRPQPEEDGCRHEHPVSRRRHDRENAGEHRDDTSEDDPLFADQIGSDPTGELHEGIRDPQRREQGPATSVADAKLRHDIREQRWIDNPHPKGQQPSAGHRQEDPASPVRPHRPSNGRQPTTERTKQRHRSLVGLSRRLWSTSLLSDPVQRVSSVTAYVAIPPTSDPSLRTRRRPRSRR